MRWVGSVLPLLGLLLPMGWRRSRSREPAAVSVLSPADAARAESLERRFPPLPGPAG